MFSSSSSLRETAYDAPTAGPMAGWGTTDAPAVKGTAPWGKNDAPVEGMPSWGRKDEVCLGEASLLGGRN